MSEIIWLVTATVETSEGSALKRDEIVGVFTDANIAKDEIGKLYTLRLLWIMHDNEYRCSVKSKWTINSEPIVEWAVSPIMANQLMSGLRNA